VPSRRLLVPTLVALLGALALAADGLLTTAFTDYENEAQPAFDALRAGHLGAFLAKAPAYGGSLILRAPFVYASHLLGGGSLAAFRAAALPCLLAGVALGVYLFARVRGRTGAYLALALAAFNPITLRALEFGHPEELLGAVLCVAAVLCALSDRPGWAGLLLGLALANKAWAVLAVGPVLLALDRGRLKAMLIAGGVAGLVLAPLVLRDATAVHGVASATGSTGPLFHPFQLWWFLGVHGDPVASPLGPPVGYRVAPGWISTLSHPAIALMGAPLSFALWRAKRPRADALGLLTLLFLLRCLLDPWDNVYYQLLFLIALLVWEVRSHGRAPLFSLAMTLVVWVTFVLAPGRLVPDGQSALYLAWALPLTAVLALRVFRPESFAARTEPLAAALRRRMPSIAAAVSA
jgi:hypothetical protein